MPFINTLRRLENEKLIHPPRWLIDNTQYVTQMGSVAYGVSNADSDQDIYGFCMPTKELLFPHLGGEIMGFGRQVKRFEQYQQHHIDDHSSGKNYDITIYSIVKYFHLCMENNPNMIDSLFTPRRCILHSTEVAERLIEKRRIFLHKGAMHKLRGYAYAQLSKIDGQYSRDRKSLAHVVEFQKNYKIESSDTINRLVKELTKRGIQHGICVT